jgi:hypothetical protein
LVVAKRITRKDGYMRYVLWVIPIHDTNRKWLDRGHTGKQKRRQ